MPLTGIPVCGLTWSVATVFINAEQVTDLGVGLPSILLLVLAGGMAQTVAVWVGFSAILWAMIRGFGERMALLRVLRLISAASWPMWLGAPAIALWSAGPAYQQPATAFMCLTGLAGLFTLTAQALAHETRGSTVRAFCAVGASVVFVSSFIYLNI